uniref:G-protein coupled receptors family 1 profile domain-containing protein n=1 Tax=Myripristis murdjan TaxID=586833 RepID=A0A667YUG4_9TELE
MLTPLKQPIVFELEGFHVPQGQGSLLFFLALLNYTVVLLGNGLVVSIIVCDRALHKPMYMMVCNLAACDLLGGSAMLIPYEKRNVFSLDLKTFTLRADFTSIGSLLQCEALWAACLYERCHINKVELKPARWSSWKQADSVAAAASCRYVAVCEPLRYHAIMTSARLLSCCALAWLVAFVCIGVLFALNVGTPLCGSTIKHVYCSNRSILRLACGPTPVNNIYGQSTVSQPSQTHIVLVITGTFLIIAFSYIRILHACVKQGRNDNGTRSKAFQTCASHLVLYVLYEIASVIIILSQRFPSVSQNIKKFCSILFIIVPPALNPIIYGLVTKELRTSIIKQFTTRVSHVKPQQVNTLR